MHSIKCILGYHKYKWKEMDCFVVPSMKSVYLGVCERCGAEKEIHSW